MPPLLLVSRPPEIDSVRAAVESGVPAALPAVLGHMDHEVAVLELTARNCSGLRYARNSTIASVGGVSSGDDEEELETVIMLAALSGNLDMFHAVLEAMKEKLPTTKQVKYVVLALQDCCSGLQVSACACACVRVCVYVMVRESSTTEYFHPCEVRCLRGEENFAWRLPRRAAFVGCDTCLLAPESVLHTLVGGQPVCYRNESTT